ncbi:MAG: hypothetical protein U0521_14385 [Anaerolineae bacterium]
MREIEPERQLHHHHEGSDDEADEQPDTGEQQDNARRGLPPEFRTRQRTVG